MKLLVKFSLLYLGLAFPLSSFSQVTKSLNTGTADFNYEDKFEVKEVYFFSPTHPDTIGWIDVLFDDGTDVPQNSARNMTNGWSKYGITLNPVAYESGFTPIIGADILFECNSGIDYSEYFIREKQSAGLDLPPKQITVIGSFFRYKKDTTIIAFPAEAVLGFEEFEIEWQIADTISAPEDEWTTIGISKNPVYVTYKKPEILTFVSTIPDRYHHSLLNIGCVSAHGQKSDDFITGAIWSKLTSLDVKGADSGSTLTYYGSYGCQNTTTEALLLTGDGQCGAWAKLFIDLLKVQNITHSTETGDYFKMNHPTWPGQDTFAYNFFVKDWSFSASPDFPDTGNSSDYKFLLVPEQDWSSGSLNLSDWIAGGHYNWQYSDGIDNLTSIPGQGNPNPESIFQNHQFNVISDFALDPSYGIPHDVSMIKTNALDAYAWMGEDIINENDFGIDFNGNGTLETTATVFVVYATDNLDLYDLEFTIFNY